MTAVFSNSKFFSLVSDNELHQYQVEVITYDGDSETVYLEARDADEAQQMAANLVANADYTMVQFAQHEPQPKAERQGTRAEALAPAQPTHAILRYCLFDGI